jgi:predicted dehydrogenase
MKKNMKWGILGCGHIARKFAADLTLVKDAQLVAVGAREQSSADAFAKEFKVKHAYSNYESLVQNPDVDVIYIATPHTLHRDHALLCMKHNKSVLCEKAFAMNLREAKEMIDFAKAHGVFLMEAFWTKLLPHYLAAKQLIAEGKVGQIKYVGAEFGFVPQHPVRPRLFDPKLGGGSLLDIGIYTVFVAVDMLGRPDVISASMTKAATGIDAQCAMRFDYNNGAIAQLFSSFSVNLAGAVNIAGDNGRIHFVNQFYRPTPSAQLEFYPGGIDSREEIRYEKAKGFGYEYEAQHVNECLQQGLTESPVLTHELTLLVMETLDRIREIAGIHYPMD